MNKADSIKAGTALTCGWKVRRRKPYTEIGIGRKNCIRCGNKARYQWNICADGNHYRPICEGCDIKLNRLVLKFMRHPHANQLADQYQETLIDSEEIV